jgi:hypothetical protein
LQVSRTRLGRRHLQSLKEDFSLGQGLHRNSSPTSKARSRWKSCHESRKIFTP